jgi:hypothetical protein
VDKAEDKGLEVHQAAVLQLGPETTDCRTADSDCKHSQAAVHLQARDSSSPDDADVVVAEHCEMKDETCLVVVVMVHD